MGTILAIDLGKARSLFCWYRDDSSYELKTVASTPQAFHDALSERTADRVVIEVYDMAGWVMDLCRALGLEIQIANVNTAGWRWSWTMLRDGTDWTDPATQKTIRAAPGRWR